MSDMPESGVNAASRVGSSSVRRYTVFKDDAIKGIDKMEGKNPKLQATAPFAVVGKLADGMQGFIEGQLNISHLALLGSNLAPPQTPFHADGKLPSMFGGKGGR